MNELKPTDRIAEEDRPASDPRNAPPGVAENHDPHSGVSDDPRVDPTPDRRHTEASA
jgi:hypothetical protein